MGVVRYSPLVRHRTTTAPTFPRRGGGSAPRKRQECTIFSRIADIAHKQSLWAPDMWRIARIIILSSLVVLPASRGARAADDFYAGKVLNIIAGFPPGGGVDGEMRVMTRYFAKYIPGNPTIVSRNMQGAGGIILGNHLYSIAAADGLTLGMPGRSGFLLSNVVPQKGISYDLAKFSYIGGAGSAANALWLHKRTGISSLDELKRTSKEIVIGALNARSENAIAPRVLATYEGWPLRVVTGYPGFSEVLIALDRGEVDGLFSHEGSVANSRPDMITSGAVKPIAQSVDAFPNVPILSEVVTNAKAKALLGLVTVPSRIELPLLGPLGIGTDDEGRLLAEDLGGRKCSHLS